MAAGKLRGPVWSALIAREWLFDWVRFCRLSSISVRCEARRG